MEEVVTAARRIERILEERPTSGMEQLIQSMQSQIQTLTKDLAKTHEQMASKAPAATPTAAFAAPPSNAVAAAQPPPAASAPTSLLSPAATPLTPLATAQPPLYNPQMKSTPVYQDQSIHSSHLTQPPVPATNRNSAFPFGLEHCEFPGLYKPALPDLRQDLNTTPIRVNNSGSGFSSPSLLQPCTKPFSGQPARSQMTCPKREAGEAIRERPGIVYPLLPRAQRPDTNVAIEAALPEASAVGRQAQPPTVVDIGSTSQPQPAPSIRRRASWKPSRKRHRNRATGVFQLPKRSPPHGHWCD